MQARHEAKVIDIIGTERRQIITSKYYTTPLVKVGDSGTQFTVDIYLADAVNVGSYGVELVVAGAPGNVTYTYAAASVASFTSLASSEGGLSGFSSSTTAGGTFLAAGSLIGSLTVGFAVAPSNDFKLAVRSANLDDLEGTAIAFNWDSFTLFSPGGGTAEDKTPPVVSMFSPADEATAVAVGSNIVLTFSEPIVKGSGHIVLKTAAGAIVATYAPDTSSALTVSGSDLVINPALDLSYGTNYLLEIGTGAIKDAAGNAYAGTTGYNFVTLNSAPVPSGPRYYTTPLVKVGDSSTQFTADIYLADVANVGSYGVELMLSGAPKDVSYTYTAAAVEGFSVTAFAAISAFSTNTLAGTAFGSNGFRIGSIIVEFAAVPTAPFKLAVVSANLDDLEGSAILANWGEFAFASATVGLSTDVIAYSWKAHTLLAGVDLTAGEHSSSTGPQGAASFTALTETSLSVSASRPIPAAEAQDTTNAVNLQDAIAILKMIVGLNVNGANQPLSPYQALAADFDGNSRVELNDAIGVLKHVVGLTGTGTPKPEWRFVDEASAAVVAIKDAAALSPGQPPAINLDLTGADATVQVGLVGYLRGDVDGSFAGAAGALDLDDAQPGYFTDLVAEQPALNLAQFGIYGST